MTDHPRYRGRFAPSPTGALHFGSLVAASASFAEARSRGGEWLVRMEDLDRPREVPGAAGDILRTLERFGFEWDGEVVYQSRRGEAYRELLERLAGDGLAYRCSCTRREVAEAGLPGPEGPVYPGTCRSRPPAAHRRHAWRLSADAAPVAFRDRLQGPREQDVASEVGDFVIRRSDGLFAYQLAVVVDDAWQAITDVVRGADLLSSTPRQIHIQRLAGLPTPVYAHVPLVVGPDGRKLSKQARSLPVDPGRPLAALLAAWRFLGQDPPPEPPSGVADFWAWALTRWDRSRIPRAERLPMPASPDPASPARDAAAGRQ
jgi:glutamyl-Q tRNA(Asp) synthetase